MGEVGTPQDDAGDEQQQHGTGRHGTRTSAFWPPLYLPCLRHVVVVAVHHLLRRRGRATPCRCRLHPGSAPLKRKNITTKNSIMISQPMKGCRMRVHTPPPNRLREGDTGPDGRSARPESASRMKQMPTDPVVGPLFGRVVALQVGRIADHFSPSSSFSTSASISLLTLRSGPSSRSGRGHPAPRRQWPRPWRGAWRSPSTGRPWVTDASGSAGRPLVQAPACRRGCSTYMTCVPPTPAGSYRPAFLKPRSFSSVMRSSA
jgi:hypothetical protein